MKTGRGMVSLDVPDFGQTEIAHKFYTDTILALEVEMKKAGDGTMSLQKAVTGLMMAIAVTVIQTTPDEERAHVVGESLAMLLAGLIHANDGIVRAVEPVEVQ